MDVFVAGRTDSCEKDYASIRIPCVINTGSRLVALAEGRYIDHDQGHNDLLASVSDDGGRTWSKPVVAARSGGDHFNNPCLLRDADTGTILLFFQSSSGDAKPPAPGEPRDRSHPIMRNLLCTSQDGVVWSEPRDVTSETLHENADAACTGPDQGVQLTRGAHKGRLVFPANEGSFPRGRAIAAIYSDDHGKSWSIGGTAGYDAAVDEVSAVETESGGLFMVTRSHGGDALRRVAWSEDGGETWGEVTAHPQLPCVRCQNALARYSFADDASRGNRSRILFAAPTVRSPRANGVIKMSYDDGKTWPVEKSAGEGPYAYSALCPLEDGAMGLLYEIQDKPLTTIRFTTFTISWLTDGKDTGMGKENAK